MRLKISPAEYLQRQERVRSYLEKEKADALVLFGAKRIAYLTGYHILATERPMALVVPTQGDIFIFVPRLEQDSAQARPMIREVLSYFEYPGKEPPLTLLADTLKKKYLTKKLLADGDGYPGYWGYEGPKLSELLKSTEIKITKLVQEMWKHKSAEEIELIRETAVWGNLAHAKLQEYTNVGESEIHVALKASTDATREMLQALGPEFGGFMRGGWPTHAGFVTGPNSALPHSMSWNRLIKEGDVLVTGATGYLDGYASELERTMIVGQPTPEQKKYFQIMLEAQTVGMEMSGPGVPLAKVDQAVWDVFKKHKVTQYAQHHTGHHLGFEAHEAPFIDRNSEGQMEPGQIYSIEPGVYIPGQAGYRHSDTILITDDGVEMITYYPRDLESLIIDA
ncbi:aminopeptidase P family protein [Candidatus Acetothermia bacterium]|nr:aminopeptidase P family protein [Candidatus Acetothermia bacterium]